MNLPGSISEIIRGSLADERRAQHELFALYKQKVFKLVSRLLAGNDLSDQEDAIQNTFIAVFKSLKLFRGDSSFDTWVYRICSKVCMTAIRKKYSKGHQLILHGRDPDQEQNAGDAMPDRICEGAEIGRYIDRALKTIRPERRLAFVLIEIESKSLQEAAYIMQVPIGTAKSRLFRARGDLETILRPVLCKE